MLTLWIAAVGSAPIPATAGAEVWPGWDVAAAGASVNGGHGYVLPTENQRVPALRSADVLIVGSSLNATVLAERIARRGKSVVLASSGTSLPAETAMALRPWVAESELAALPPDVRRRFRESAKEPIGGEVLLDLAKLTTTLEDGLFDAGVGLLYGVHPCGALRKGRRVEAVLFACKGGLVAVEARAVVDGTPDARLAALAGARVEPREPDHVELRYSMLCEGDPPGRVLAVPEVDGVAGGKVAVHGPLAEFRVRAPRETGPFADGLYGLEARLVAARAAMALRRSGVWPDARFARGGDVVLTGPTARIHSASGSGSIDLAACRPREVDNLLVASAAIDVPDREAARLSGNTLDVWAVPVLASVDWDAVGRGEGEEPAELRVSAAKLPQDGPGPDRACFHAVGPIYETGEHVELGSTPIPVVAKCDVVVVGGGTSGVPAAVVAAEEGLDTILLEMHGDVGGTHTIGGVSKYWFGRQTDFVAGLDRRADRLPRETGMPECMGMLDVLLTAGVRVVPRVFAVGALCDGRRVTGVVVATRTGLAAIRAGRTIDATGDGDIAARAGAKTDYGTARDAMTMWYSFAMFQGARPEASREYNATVDLRDPAELTRAIVASRRRPGMRGWGDYPQFYLAPRESRHVRGRRTVTYGDIVAGRRFRDVVLVCRSNFDIKGIAGSDLVRCGFNEKEYTKNYDAPIPYGALLPEGLEDILVIGKAYSVTHDALSLARMQRDLKAMGGAAGLAAAAAAKDGKTCSEVDVPALQRRLVEADILEDSDLAGLPESPGDELPPATVEQPLDLAGTVRLLAQGDAALPALRDALAEADGGRRLALGRAMCFLGDRAGADVVLDELDRQLAADRLPRHRYRHLAPDHGYAPEPAALICLLGRAGDKRVLPRLAPLARRIGTEDVNVVFEYAAAICFAAERIADPRGMEALGILADNPAIRGRLLPVGTDLRRTRDHVAERWAYLELSVGRAMARCGSRRGYDVLIGYLEDIRGVLARSAHDELVDLAGRDLHYDPAAWRAWLDAAGPLRPKPYGGRHE